MKVNCDIEVLDGRPDNQDNFIQRFQIKEALLDSAVSTWSFFSYWVDKNDKPMLAYFGDSYNKENAHSISVK
jgi:hypothetical protein